jgi:hypothetical protein
MLTVEGVEEFPCPSLTTSEKPSAPVLAGALKVGLALAELLRVTAGPDVWVQEYASESPSESELPVPSSVTVDLLKTVCAEPGLAVGGEFDLSPPPPPQALMSSTRNASKLTAMNRDPWVRKGRSFF